MKQNQKGFTLIELLAVIVILAIIALIAVPVIMNIISSARKSAFEDTAYGIIKAGEMYYAASLLDSGMVEDAEFIITDGEFIGENKLEVKGSLPQSGKLVVARDGKTALAISNGTYCVTKGYEESKITAIEEFEICDLPTLPQPGTLAYLAKTNDFATSINACATTGVCAPGTKFAIEVAPGDIKNFYVISDVDNQVTLIMDRNVDEETVAWISEEDYGCGEAGDECSSNEKGPITALNYLESQTSEWTNIEAKNYTLKDDNETSRYEIERTNARARLITHTEVTALIGANSWLSENLNSWDASTGPYDYWTSSAHKGGIEVSWGINSEGELLDFYVFDECGVRPVIEILKSK